MDSFVLRTIQPTTPRSSPSAPHVRSLRAAVDPLILNTAMPLTFTPSFHISVSHRAAAESSVLGSAGERSLRHTIVRVLGSLCAAVDSFVSNTAAFTYLHPVSSHF